MTYSIALVLLVFSCFLVIYHHLLYPLVLRYFLRQQVTEALSVKTRKYQTKAAAYIQTRLELIWKEIAEIPP